ncbi:MAG: SagB/ThcOx family dehydrogenase [Planctomycetaceae bacterium]|jgi:nitroreductase|nr:SagB/ThcOx family dehydrogenase [Planctomycetaceae bacterium]
MKKIILASVLAFICTTLFAQDIELPAPTKTGGIPVFDAIDKRASLHDVQETPIKLQDLSDLLWVANGITRGDKRTIPTAMNLQEIDVYVVLKEGTYLYDAKENKLILKLKGDHRRKAGKQDYVYVAPVNFIYVADRTKVTGPESYLSAGCATQNVYHACTSKDLGCRIRTSIDKNALKEVLKLNDKQEPLAGQTIGYKK